jgi:regulator of replication initiation timing
MTSEQFDEMDDSELFEYVLEMEDQINRMGVRIAHLASAIELTIEKNSHLADGEDCTLIHLVRAIGWKPAQERGTE